MFTFNTHCRRFNAILPAICVALLCIPALIGRAVGQGLPNAGYEEWVGSGNPEWNWEEPNGWTSSNRLMLFEDASASRYSMAHAGSLACSLKTHRVFEKDIPGVIVNGNPTIDFDNDSLHVMSGGTPISNRPVKLTGFYQYSTAIDDYGYALVILKKYNAAKSKSEVVGIGETYLYETFTYTQFDVEIEYWRDDQPDSVIVALYSTDPSAPLPSGTLIVDDIALVDDESRVDDFEMSTEGLRVYPNPTTGAVNIEIANEHAGVGRVVFYDLLGCEVMSKRFEGASTTMDLLLPAGLYTYRMTRGDKEFIGKIVVGR